jgi:hypothetical protein
LVLSQAANLGLGGGQLNIYNAAGSTQVVVDLVGYYQDTSDVPSLNGEAHFITGTADPAADQGAIGDMYINNTTNSLFGPKTASGWGNAIRLGGSIALTGTTDPTPDQGGLGDVYLNTATNTLFGPKSAQGWGTGSPLGSHVLSGTVDPTTEGIIGDIYLNTATNTLFGPKTAQGWGAGSQLGTHFLTGTVDPTTEGIIGDIYLNTATNTLFGPKTAGGWAVSRNLNPALLTATGTSYTSPSSGTWYSIPGATLTLPPGKWFVSAKGNNANASAAQQIDVRLLNTATSVEIDHSALYEPGTNQSQFYLGQAVNLTATTTFQVQMISSVAAATAVNVKVYASQVSTINGA